MHCENRAGKLEAAGHEELWGGSVGSVINIGHRVYDAALIAQERKRRAPRATVQRAALGVGVGVADAHEPPAIRSSHIVAASGAASFFFSFVFPF